MEPERRLDKCNATVTWSNIWRLDPNGNEVRRQEHKG